MASEHETLVAEFVSPFFVETFGERDAQGDFAKIVAHPPGREPFEISGPILSASETAQIEDERGELVKRQIRTLRFPRQSGLTVIELKTTFVIDGQTWAVQQIGSREDGNWLTYQLERKPLQQMDNKRDARSV